MDKFLAKGVSILKKSTQSGLCAVYKPAGVLAHPNSIPKQAEKTLLKAPYDHEQEAYLINENQQRVWLLNRLDRGTSGVLLMSTSRDVSAHVKTKFAKRKVRKQYTALCFGRKSNFDFQVVDNMMVDSMRVARNKGGQAIAQAADPSSKGALMARTLIKEVTEGIMKVEGSQYAVPVVKFVLEPLTGLTHQLRYQLYSRHFPIIGDNIYSTEESRQLSKMTKNSKRALLHSSYVGVVESDASDILGRVEGENEVWYDHKDDHFKDEVYFEAEAPLPADMQSIVDNM
jgi:23S rRNA-/tRNA-specific pseudouridylate synthase